MIVCVWDYGIWIRVVGYICASSNQGCITEMDKACREYCIHAQTLCEVASTPTKSVSLVCFQDALIFDRTACQQMVSDWSGFHRPCLITDKKKIIEAQFGRCWSQAVSVDS